MVFSSPRHLMAAGGCIIVMEYAYKMDFSLAGFVICSSILGFGMYNFLFIFLEVNESFIKKVASPCEYLPSLLIRMVIH